MDDKKTDIKAEKPVSKEAPQEQKPMPKIQVPKKTEVEVEVGGKWIPAGKVGFGIDITGVRINTSETRVKTKNGWFTESDPEKAPVLMIETADKNIRLSAHVKGGSWLPLTNGKTGCNIAIDSMVFML